MSTTTTEHERRIAACLSACAGLSTEQLEGMVKDSGDGVLAEANQVCEYIWERHGMDLRLDDPIDGGDAVDTISEVYTQLEAVVRHARSTRFD